MKKHLRLSFCLVLLLAFTGLQAQPPGPAISFARGTLQLERNLTGDKFDRAVLQPALVNNQYHLILQFDQLPDVAQKESLRRAGVQLGSYLPGNAYLATVKASADFTGFASRHIIAAGNLPAFYKIDPAIATANLMGSKDVQRLFAIGLFPGVDDNFVRAAIEQTGAFVATGKFLLPDVIYIRPDKGLLEKIAALPFVSYISLHTIADKPLNYKGRGLHGMNALLAPAGRALTGRNITVGVGDNAEISTHIDFTGRLINRVYSVPSFHGIHTSGTVAGAGILDVKNHGMAPKATIISQWFSDVVTNTPVYVADYNMIATNNSYTAAEDGCIGEGVYDVLSNYADAQMRSFPTVLHVFSAGNDGLYTCSPYPAAYGTVKTGWQCAKNVLTVGAMNQLDYTIASFSSRGPVLDGRLKPEIVASGVNVFSTRHNNSYGNNSGTSMSGPMVAGAATVLNERYRQLNGGAIPKASLIKALLCNTAEDLGNPGPDYTFGFGMLNARRATEAMEGNQYFISNTPGSFPISVPAGARRLKVMLYWADPEALPSAGVTLVNDLDLTVTDPAAAVILPLILDPFNVTANAVPGADHRNNMEQVTIDAPAAGTYTLNVSAFNVPAGPQEYILTYQVDMNGITVEYPFGGETLVPGETETIRWSAYGDEANTFTVEYSTDNGGSWTTISNSVAASARSVNWVVPATVTNTALIRVSRNASVYTDQSDYYFVILGQPTLSTSIPCEGYAQLSWTAVTGATSYDILQLKGDSMSVIGNTASLNFLVTGLNSSTTYWFGVAAKNTAVSGRRSVSVSALPATGTCALAGFDNNFKAASLDAPVSGRQFTSSAPGNNETVKLTVKNLDNVASSGNFDLSYQVNGGAIVTETASAPVAALGSYQYSFVQKADLSVPGIYTFKAWVKKAGDTQVLDDTVTAVIKSLANPVLTLPVTDDFEATVAKEYTSNSVGIDGADKADFKTNNSRGRARTFVNTGVALSGSKAISLDQFPYGTLVTDSLLMTYNASNYGAGNQLRFDFYYKNHGQANNPDNKVWIRGNDSQPWVFAYDLVANQAALGQWKHGFINVNDVLDTVLPAQPIGSSFQIKFGQQGNTSINVPFPVLDQDDGYTFDDVSLTEALNDVAITQVVSPAATGCNMSGTQAVSIRIKNYSATSFSNVPVNYRVNGGAVVSELVSAIAPNSTQVYTFSTPAVLAQNTDYNFDFWIKAPTDNYSTNDSVLSYSFHTSPLITTYPYLEGFESNDGNWYAKGSNSSWQWGTPVKATINKAANGTKAWVTSLTGNYANNELSYLYSPCFDLHTLTQPVLSFSHIYAIEDGCPCDYNWVEYSVDGGITWNKLGTNGGGVNWYNDPTGLHQWRTSFTKWHVASVNIPTTGTNVRFRIVMASDGGFNMEGVGIDDIHIFDKAPVYTGTQLLNTTQTVNGSGWVYFNSGGNRIAGLNANGQNLGATTVDVYPYSGAVRNSNNQYYLNRNIVVHPANVPAGPVSVRFFFTDTEAKSLIAATGCTPCSKPGDPYELGVTKYSGPLAQENGTLTDNLPGGLYSFILPANTDIIPYDNGYYAEFSVNSFSEFWLSNGGLNNNQPLPLNLVSFEAVKKDRQGLLRWATANEINTAKFIVERSADGNSYSAIGEVTALHNGAANNYQLTDVHPLSGLNFYRLKMMDQNGDFRYSPIRKLDFSQAADDISIYPNPVTQSRLYITSSGNARTAVLYDMTGKVVKTYLLTGRNNTLDLTGISAGVFELKVMTDNTVVTQKIIRN